MSVSSESAEQMMRMILEGEEVTLKIIGKSSKELIALIAAIMKSKTQTKGKTRLTNMLKSGKELKVFSLRKKDMQKFMQEAKRYGVLYSALVSKHNKNFDGMVDIMVRAEDAPKINRIVERFKLLTMDEETTIRTDIERKRTEKAQKESKNIGVQTKDLEIKEKEEEELKPIQKESNQNTVPLVKKDHKENQLEHSSGMLKNREGNTNMKKSVRLELKEIKEEMDVKKQKSASDKNITPNVKAEKKSKKHKKDKTAR